jgi:hypothetical protein
MERGNRIRLKRVKSNRNKVGKERKKKGNWDRPEKEGRGGQDRGKKKWRGERSEAEEGI